MPTPIDVIVDFERSKIVFAVEASSRADWPRITPPQARGLVSAAYTTYDRSVEDARARVAAVEGVAHWIDVTDAYRDISVNLFSRLGPEYRNHVSEGGEVSSRLDDRNCHQVTSLACLSRVYDYITDEILRAEGLIEVPEDDRRFARVSLVLDETTGGLEQILPPLLDICYEISPERSPELDWSNRVTTYHSMINLPGTDWVIHKEGYGSTLLGAAHIDDATAPYRENLYPTETRYFAGAEILERVQGR